MGSVIIQWNNMTIIKDSSLQEKKKVFLKFLITLGMGYVN